MALTQPDDLEIHEAGHALFGYLIDDLMEIRHITIDNKFSKQISPLSDGGVLLRYIKHPDSLHYFEHDLFCLSNLSGFAADLVNEFHGSIPEHYFGSEAFVSKLGMSYYIGDLAAFNNSFQGVQPNLKYSQSTYNQTSIRLLISILSNEEILPVLLFLREALDKQKTIYAKDLYEILDQSYLAIYKNTSWLSVKEIRKKLFL